MEKNSIIDMLTAYAANAISGCDIAEKLNKDEDEVFNILGEFQKEWDEAPCDEGGPTREQDAHIDEILENYAQELLDAKDYSI